MENAEHPVNPEAVKMREEYNANVQRAFDKFGFTEDVIKKIKDSGNLPILKYEIDFTPSSWFAAAEQLSKFGGDLGKYLIDKTDGKLVSAAYLTDDFADLRTPWGFAVNKLVRRDQVRQLLIYPNHDQIYVGQRYRTSFDQENISDNLREDIVRLPEVVMNLPGVFAASYPHKK